MNDTNTTPLSSDCRRSNPQTNSLGIPNSITEAMDVTSSRSLDSSHRSIKTNTLLPPTLMQSHRRWDEAKAGYLSSTRNVLKKPYDDLCGDIDCYELDNKQEEITEEKTWLWHVTSGLVKPAPKWCPLERTSKVICDSSVDEIARRISQCLQRRSVAASYSSTEAKALCSSADGVEFYIRLYSFEYSEDIIVEVQRWCGDSVSFQKVFNAIMDCVQGTLNDENDSSSLRSLPVTATPSSDDDCSAGLSLQLASTMLEENSIDAKLSALTGLTVLTDASKVGVDAAICNSYSIFEQSKLHLELESIVQQKSSDNQLKHLALAVLKNSIKTLSIASLLKESMSKNLWAEKLVNACLDITKSAGLYPHDATLALECLEVLVEETDGVKNVIIQRRALADILAAKQCGMGSHASLESAANNVLHSLRCS
mmetsp:Transcript_6825/g.10011  ORF Transcript_6825/g.10011 Transcript_6825/m.10011 type:complete len:425 (+) Transcript_6825:59-1333(+)